MFSDYSMIDDNAQQVVRLFYFHWSVLWKNVKEWKKSTRELIEDIENMMLIVEQWVSSCEEYYFLLLRQMKAKEIRKKEKCDVSCEMLCFKDLNQFSFFSIFS